MKELLMLIQVMFFKTVLKFSGKVVFDKNGNIRNIKGEYFGPISFNLGLIKFFFKHGIDFITMESIYKKSDVISVAFSPKEQKWYGWSHRAIYGFKIGDIAKEGDCCTLSGFTQRHLKDHPEDDRSIPVGFKAETLADCRKMAIAFSESVS